MEKKLIKNGNKKLEKQLIILVKTLVVRSSVNFMDHTRVHALRYV